MGEAIVRFIIGGMFVSVFAILGDLLKPKSFAGLFGAAPSVALATLLLTVHRQGASYAAIEARSMIEGAIAFCAYAYCVCCVGCTISVPPGSSPGSSSVYGWRLPSVCGLCGWANENQHRSVRSQKNTIA
jgi:hypothetical protein